MKRTGAIGVIIFAIFVGMAAGVGFWAATFNVCPQERSADLNEDGIVDMTDYSILMSQLEN